MPCYTLVQVEVKDKDIAEKALSDIGEEATIEKNANGKYTVTPKKQNVAFKDQFLTEYGVNVATKEAKAQGYMVSRTEEDGETVLFLRQY